MFEKSQLLKFVFKIHSSNYAAGLTIFSVTFEIDLFDIDLFLELNSEPRLPMKTRSTATSKRVNTVEIASVSIH